MAERDSYAETVRSLIASEVGHAEVVIVSLDVNGERVDAVVTADEHMWHIVFGTPDGTHVDWVNVFERPPRFDGVPCGRTVILNGPSSVGKSTIMAALARRSPFPWVTFDEPIVGTVDAGYLIWREQSAILHRGFIDGIAAVSRAGNYVVVSAAGHSQARFLVPFSDVATIKVGLDCSLAELERREATRRDVRGGLAASSLDVHDGWQYHVRFDTAVTDTDTIVDEILAMVDGPPLHELKSRPHLSLIEGGG